MNAVEHVARRGDHDGQRDHVGDVREQTQKRRMQCQMIRFPMSRSTFANKLRPIVSRLRSPDIWPASTTTVIRLSWPMAWRTVSQGLRCLRTPDSFLDP